MSIPIIIIKATNSFFMVALPMQLLYKVRYLPRMSIYLPKFFIAIQQIKGLVLIFVAFTFSFLFSYTILSVLDFKMGSVKILDDVDIKEHKFDYRFNDLLNNISPIFGAFI